MLSSYSSHPKILPSISSIFSGLSASAHEPLPPAIYVPRCGCPNRCRPSILPLQKASWKG